MPKKRSQVKLEFGEEFAQKIDALKKYYRVQSGAELVKILVNEKTQQLNTNPTEATKNGTQNKKVPNN